jgi:hypothetical protein
VPRETFRYLIEPIAAPQRRLFCLETLFGLDANLGHLGPLLSNGNGGRAAPVWVFSNRRVCLFHLGLVERDVHDGALCTVACFVVGDDGDGE